MMRDTPDGVEDVFVNMVSGIIAADAAGNLKDGGLKCHDKNGAKSERSTEKHPNQHYNELHAELDKTDWRLGKAIPDDYHQSVARSAA